MHGFTLEMLQGKPKFAEIVEEFLGFLGTDPIVAHNAPFDFGFLDAELARPAAAGSTAARMVDSLALAKKRFPGMPNSLDALCRRLGIDNSMRTSHNALLDVKLLAAGLPGADGRQAARPGAGGAGRGAEGRRSAGWPGNARRGRSPRARRSWRRMPPS